jgi:DNA-binding NarL/FixJ family response regulator
MGKMSEGPEMTSIRGMARPPRQRVRTLASVDALGADSACGNDTIRVLIAYGDNFARTGLRALVNAEGDMAAVGGVADGDAALALAAQLRPDVLLVDIALPGGGVELTRRLAVEPESSNVRVLILSASEDDDEVFASIRAGASGFLRNDVEPDELVAAVRTIAGGEAALSSSVVRRVMAELASRPDPLLPAPDQLKELTRREREVMALVARGLSNDEIAHRLVVAPATAKTHVSRALAKLRVRDRAQLVTLAFETGLVLPKKARGAEAVTTKFAA